MKITKRLKRVVKIIFRSAITGRFISRKDAEQHPDTSVRERSWRER